MIYSYRTNCAIARSLMGDDLADALGIQLPSLGLNWFIAQIAFLLALFVTQACRFGFKSHNSPESRIIEWIDRKIVTIVKNTEAIPPFRRKTIASRQNSTSPQCPM
jgi:hypothetical protein